MNRWFVLLGCLVAVPTFFVLAGRSPHPDRFGVSVAASKVSGLRTHDVPHLIIRCQDHKTEAYVVIGMSAQPELGQVGKHTVLLRFDDHQLERELWDRSADDQALFSRSPVRFVKQVAHSKTLTFEFTPFQASPAIATFSIVGFDRRLPALRRCAS